MARTLAAFLIGCVFVAMVTMYNRHEIGESGFISFLLLLPGILAVDVVSGGTLDFKTDSHPLVVSLTVLLYGFDIALYGGVAYLFLFFVRWPPKDAK